VRVDLEIYICVANGTVVVPSLAIGVIAHLALASGAVGIP